MKTKCPVCNGTDLLQLKKFRYICQDCESTLLIDEKQSKIISLPGIASRKSQRTLVSSENAEELVIAKCVACQKAGLIPTEIISLPYLLKEPICYNCALDYKLWCSDCKQIKKTNQKCVKCGKIVCGDCSSETIEKKPICRKCEFRLSETERAALLLNLKNEKSTKKEDIVSNIFSGLRITLLGVFFGFLIGLLLGWLLQLTEFGFMVGSICGGCAGIVTYISIKFSDNALSCDIWWIVPFSASIIALISGVLIDFNILILILSLLIGSILLGLGGMGGAAFSGFIQIYLQKRISGGIIGAFSGLILGGGFGAMLSSIIQIDNFWLFGAITGMTISLIPGIVEGYKFGSYKGAAISGIGSALVGITIGGLAGGLIGALASGNSIGIVVGAVIGALSFGFIGGGYGVYIVKRNSLILNRNALVILNLLISILVGFVLSSVLVLDPVLKQTGFGYLAIIGTSVYVLTSTILTRTLLD